MIIEIAGGIILAVIVLRFWREVLMLAAFALVVLLGAVYVSWLAGVILK